jgi:tetratricopeptide (TPR) repeat protein
VDRELSKLAELLKLRQKLQGNDHAETLLSMSKLASAYTSAEQFDASARVQGELCELVLNLSRRVSADESYWAALALLASGKLHEYRRACQQLLTSFEETGNDDFADRAVRASVLANLSESIAKELVAAAEAVKGLSAGNERLLGACLYRTGEYEKGLTAFAKSHRKSEPTSWDYCFLAMLHAKLGNDEEAKAALSAARNARKQEGEAEWYSKVEIESLLAEATALIEGSPSGSSD